MSSVNFAIPDFSTATHQPYDESAFRKLRTSAKPQRSRVPPVALPLPDMGE